MNTQATPTSDSRLPKPDPKVLAAAALETTQSPRLLNPQQQRQPPPLAGIKRKRTPHKDLGGLETMALAAASLQDRHNGTEPIYVSSSSSDADEQEEDSDPLTVSVSSPPPPSPPVQVPDPAAAEHVVIQFATCQDSRCLLKDRYQLSRRLVDYLDQHQPLIVEHAETSELALLPWQQVFAIRTAGAVDQARHPKCQRPGDGKKKLDDAEFLWARLGGFADSAVKYGPTVMRMEIMQGHLNALSRCLKSVYDRMYTERVAKRADLHDWAVWAAKPFRSTERSSDTLFMESIWHTILTTCHQDSPIPDALEPLPHLPSPSDMAKDLFPLWVQVLQENGFETGIPKTHKSILPSDSDRPSFLLPIGVDQASALLNASTGDGDTESLKRIQRSRARKLTLAEFSGMLQLLRCHLEISLRQIRRYLTQFCPLLSQLMLQGFGLLVSHHVHILYRAWRLGRDSPRTAVQKSLVSTPSGIRRARKRARHSPA